MARWLIGVLVLALSASPARAACWAGAWQDALDAIDAIRNSRPTTPTRAEDRVVRAACGPDEACAPGLAPRRTSPMVDGSFVLIVLAPVLAIGLVPLALVMWLFWYLRRRRDADEIRRPEAISLLAVERIARAIQRRGGVLAAIGIAGVPVLAAAQSLTAIASTIVACVGIRGFCVGRALLRLIEGPAASAVRLGTTMIVHRGDDEMHVEVSALALARASRHAVPTSVAKRA